LLPERRPFPLGRRGALFLGLALSGLVAALALGLHPRGLVPSEGGRSLALDFLSAALSPAVDYEGWVPDGATPFLSRIALALGRTLLFAAAAMSVALLLGLPLGFLASDAWWRRAGSGAQRVRRLLRPLQVAVRVGIALLRSVHELLWAVIFLAAFGLDTFAAVIAVGLPYGGTLAKVFSEMLDEAPRDSAEALRALGGRPLGVLLFGLFPRALPDFAAYTFYRLECAVRASAVLGFFGYPTIGYHLQLSFREGHFREVWTCLYALGGLVVLLEGWSALLRRRANR